MAPAGTSPLSSTTVSLPELTLAGARIALAAAEKRALEIGVPMNIAITSSSLYLLHFTRMNGAKLTSISIAMDKAFTAAGHKIPTSSYTTNVYPGGAAFGINNSNGGRFCTIGGGVPIIDEEGRVLGAVGCSTGTPAQDEDVASAGVKAVLAVLRKEREDIANMAKEEEEKRNTQQTKTVKRKMDTAETTKQKGLLKRSRVEVTPPAENGIAISIVA